MSERFRMRDYKNVMRELQSINSSTISPEVVAKAKQVNSAMNRKISSHYSIAKAETNMIFLPGVVAFEVAAKLYGPAIGTTITILLAMGDAARHLLVASRREKQKEKLASEVRRISPSTFIY